MVSEHLDGELCPTKCERRGGDKCAAMKSHVRPTLGHAHRKRDMDLRSDRVAHASFYSDDVARPLCVAAGGVRPRLPRFPEFLHPQRRRC